MSGVLAAAVTLALGGLAPCVVMALLAPQLAEVVPRAQNYRGRPVFVGLGIAWAAWMAGLLLARGLLDAAGCAPAWLGDVCAAAPLVLGACALGMLDDLAGRRERQKGFRGHLRALRSGRLTLGALKLLGVGALSLAAALGMSGPCEATPAYVGAVAAHTLVMALSANAANLLDVRPARALKGYVAGLLALVAGLACWQAASWGLSGVALVGVLSLAPACAVWRLDAGERGMLGDAGANAMGAYLGFLAASALPVPVSAVIAAALFALNVAAERVSLSDVIARSRVLGRLDAWGRPRE